MQELQAGQQWLLQALIKHTCSTSFYFTGVQRGGGGALRVLDPKSIRYAQEKYKCRGPPAGGPLFVSSPVFYLARFTMTVHTLPLRYPALTQRNCYNAGHSYEANAASNSSLLTQKSVYLREANTLQLKQLLTPN